MPGLFRSVFASVLLFLLLPSLAAAQCAAGDEVCLQATDQASGQGIEQAANKSTEEISKDDVTTETFSDEQATLVSQITRNLKRRRLTLRADGNALDQIRRLKKIHPRHDYAVNGERYIARILMSMGRKALSIGDPVLANRHLQKAIELDPQVARQSVLKEGIAAAGTSPTTGSQSLLENPDSNQLADGSGAVSGSSGQPADAESDSSRKAPIQKDDGHKENGQEDRGDSEPLASSAPDKPAVYAGKTTTETFTDEQAELVAGITRDLKRRSLLAPSGNNALEKIQRLKEVHPSHDYSVNGTRYIARILMVLGRRALRQGDLELASRHMLKAIQFDPDVKRQDELKTAIAEAARQSARDRETERETKALVDALAEGTTSVTSYLQTDRTAVVQSDLSEDIEFVAPVMVAIPAGDFLMGSDEGAADEKPVHHVVLEAFSMSKHEITVQQYRVFALVTGRPAPQFLPQESNLPVTNVSWHDAVAYTEWLSQRTKRQFRLPTESEWEYSARAGTTSAYFTGDTLVNAANCAGCSGRWDGKSVAPVGNFTPNEFGLYDTHGNVWEWVQDCWTDNYIDRGKSSAAVELEGCERRVLRGGSWNSNADYARVSYRGNEMAYFRDGGVGFRVVHEGL